MNLALAQLYDSANQCQAQAISSGSVSGIFLIEFIKDMSDVLLFNSNSFISNSHCDAGRFHSGRYVDFPIVMAKFDGIANQISPHMIHHFCIAAVWQFWQV